MRLQLSIEILVGMLIALLVALTVTGYLLGARSLIIGARSSLSALANLTGSYPSRLLAG